MRVWEDRFSVAVAKTTRVFTNVGNDPALAMLLPQVELQVRSLATSLHNVATFERINDEVVAVFPSDTALLEPVTQAIERQLHIRTRQESGVVLVPLPLLGEQVCSQLQQEVVDEGKNSIWKLYENAQTALEPEQSDALSALLWLRQLRDRALARIADLGDGSGPAGSKINNRPPSPLEPGDLAADPQIRSD